MTAIAKSAKTAKKICCWGEPAICLILLKSIVTASIKEEQKKWFIKRIKGPVRFCHCARKTKLLKWDS